MKLNQSLVLVGNLQEYEYDGSFEETGFWPILLLDFDLKVVFFELSAVLLSSFPWRKRQKIFFNTSLIKARPAKNNFPPNLYFYFGWLVVWGWRIEEIEN